MHNPKLPVIYAVIEDGTNSPVTACESNKDAELNASAQHRMSETREYRVVAYPPPPESPPREYWRILEEGEEIRLGDHRWSIDAIDGWVVVEREFVGKKANAWKFCRRVSPPPTCETCELLHGETCSFYRRLVRPDDYCSKHPQAQEANRG